MSLELTPGKNVFITVTDLDLGAEAIARPPFCERPLRVDRRFLDRLAETLQNLALVHPEHTPAKDSDLQESLDRAFEVAPSWAKPSFQVFRHCYESLTYTRKLPSNVPGYIHPLLALKDAIAVLTQEFGASAEVIGKILRIIPLKSTLEVSTPFGTFECFSVALSQAPAGRSGKMISHTKGVRLGEKVWYNDHPVIVVDGNRDSERSSPLRITVARMDTLRRETTRRGALSDKAQKI
jgi:hypothetical protein